MFESSFRSFRPFAIPVLLAVALAGCSSADGSSQKGPPSAMSKANPSRGAGATTAEAAPGSSAALPDSLTEAADRGRVLGADTAPVWLLMVSDFQCPWCKKWHDETYPAIKRDYVDAGKVKVAYLNYPMAMHLNARPAAIAAMCASAQGKFWQTHDRIFQMQGTWEKQADPRPYLDSLAVASGADAARQRACSAGGKLNALIDADFARAHQAQVTGTPVFFVGGRRIDGAEPIGVFRMVIDSVLRAGTRNK